MCSGLCDLLQQPVHVLQLRLHAQQRSLFANSQRLEQLQHLVHVLFKQYLQQLCLWLRPERWRLRALCCGLRILSEQRLHCLLPRLFPHQRAVLADQCRDWVLQQSVHGLLQQRLLRLLRRLRAERRGLCTLCCRLQLLS
jgi:hypothetical protein